MPKQYTDFSSNITHFSSNITHSEKGYGSGSVQLDMLLDPGMPLPLPREKAVITQETPGYKYHLRSLSWGN